MPGKVFNIAHRGLSCKYPDNTLVAFRKAVEAGADFIELDVQTSRDGHVVVFHDTTVDEMTDGVGAVHDLTLDELKRLDPKCRFLPDVRGERIPTLRETFEALKATPMKFCVEIKGRDEAAAEETLTHALRLIETCGVLDRCVLTSFKPEDLRLARSLLPVLPSALDPDDKTAFTPRELCTQVLSAGANILSLRHDYLTAELVDEVHAHGIPIWVWTVNEEQDMRRAIEAGADAIMTDDPERLRDVLVSGEW